MSLDNKYDCKKKKGPDPHFRIDKRLILLIKKHPVTYLPIRNKRISRPIKAELDKAWGEIASKLGLHVYTCKQLWRDTKFKYAKLMLLIQTGNITKEDAMSNPETKECFDGQFIFLNSFITKMTDVEIPYRIHKYINDLFGIKTKKIRRKVQRIQSFTQLVTHRQVKALIATRELEEGTDSNSIDMEYLQTVVDTAIKLKLEELQLIKQTSSVPLIDYESIINATMVASKDIPDVSKSKPSLGLESELIIEDDIKTENYIDVIEENITPDNNKMTNILSDTLNEESQVIGQNIHGIVMADNADIPNDDHIRNFFKELGDVLSLELSTCKQKILQSQINELLKSLILPKPNPKANFSSNRAN